MSASRLPQQQPPSPRQSTSRAPPRSSSLQRLRLGATAAATPGVQSSVQGAQAAVSTPRRAGSRSPSPSGRVMVQMSRQPPAPPGSVETPIRVVVRFRPLGNGSSSGSLLANRQDDSSNKEAFAVRGSMTVEAIDRAFSWEFDRVFGPEAQQIEVYRELGRPVVADVLDGYHGTIIAYGQTGTGKTFSTFGPDFSRPELHGLAPRAARQLFGGIERSNSKCSFVLRCSMLEIYREQLRDLQNPATRDLKIQETPAGGVAVDGLSEECVTCEQDVLDLLETGERMRVAAATQLSQQSSRSHVLFFLTCEQKLSDGSEKTGRLCLADLAGSEKPPVISGGGATASATGRQESRKINCSLNALRQVVEVLSEQQSQAPYRSSQLTRLLQQSLGGNCKTTMLVTCSLDGQHASETTASLRFAVSARGVRNRVSVNLIRSREHLSQRVGQLRRELTLARSEAAQLGAVVQNMSAEEGEKAFAAATAAVSAATAAVAAAAADGFGSEEQPAASPDEKSYEETVFLPRRVTPAMILEKEAIYVSVVELLEAKTGRNNVVEMLRCELELCQKQSRLEYRFALASGPFTAEEFAALEKDEDAELEALEDGLSDVWAKLRARRRASHQAEAYGPFSDVEDSTDAEASPTHRATGSSASPDRSSAPASARCRSRRRSHSLSENQSGSRAPSAPSSRGGSPVASASNSIGAGLIAAAAALRQNKRRGRRNSGGSIVRPVRRCDVERDRREKAKEAMVVQEDDGSDSGSCTLGAPPGIRWDGAEMVPVQSRAHACSDVQKLQAELDGILLETEAVQKARHESMLMHVRRKRERVRLLSAAELVPAGRMPKSAAVADSIAIVREAFVRLARSRLSNLGGA